MIRPWILALVGLLAAGMSGCGTCRNVGIGGDGYGAIYGGTLQDATAALVMPITAAAYFGGAEGDPEMTPGQGLAIEVGMALDLPFSIVGDTVTLPLTVYHTVAGGHEPLSLPLWWESLRPKRPSKGSEVTNARDTTEQNLP
jgi:uncharacterized protein YceK